VEPSPGAGRGLVAALAHRACLVVTDDWPCFHLPKRVEAAGRAVDVRLEAVDGNGLLPLADAPADPFPTAYAFRRHLQRVLPTHLAALPDADPLPASLPAPDVDPAVIARWPPGFGPDLSTLPIDHDVTAVHGTPGGPVAASRLLARFVVRLDTYDVDRNDPDTDGTSRLSPYLHFGHVGSHEVFAAIAAKEGWTPGAVGGAGRLGSRAGWWGMSASAEAFLDQLVTWRELGFNFTSRRADYAEYGSLPDWARRTLAEHATDPRPRLYTLEQLEGAQTHDALWNAAQRQLVREGRIHNYLRMLWGKKILEWSPSPEAAAERLVALNDRWALDGRDPNSYSGTFWVLGRYDRAWGPVRPIFGTIRYMSSDNTAKKWSVTAYLRRWSA
jgi:deoxyribodipyrimidine photo-lyase